MKIRIFALAKELGMDSKELIDLCSQAGIELKNSALASITPAERDIVVGFMDKSETTPDVQTKHEPVAPVREQLVERQVGSKIRNLVGASPRPRSGMSPTSSSLQSETSSSATAVAEPPTVGTSHQASVEVADDIDVEVDIPEVEPAQEESEVVTEADAVEVDSPETVVEVKAESPIDSAAKVEQPIKVAAPAAPTVPTVAPKKPLAPMSRSDYVSPVGGGMVPEMKPLGSISDEEVQRRRSVAQKGKKQSLPAIAAPPKAPAVKTQKPQEEPQKSQKPTVRFTPGMREQSPLSGHMQRQKTEETRPQTSRARPAGAGLKDRYQKERKSFKAELRLKRGGRGKRTRRQVELKTSAQIVLPITVRSLSEAIGRPAKSITSLLFKQGKMATINESLDEDIAIELAMELGVDLVVKRGRDLEQELTERLDHPDPDESKVERPPIVTILGHVDHGKTTLVDKLRSAKVAEGEAGGITQHIAAYQVTHLGKKVTFVDTPGHAAFSEMRARGANVTDIVVLVVAADDGVMPQTVECISHARLAGVPVIVALNKIDLPGIDENRALQGLIAHELLPSEYGGEIEVVRTSGQTGQGLDDLIETIQLTAELHEYKACPEREAFGVCLEAFMDEGRGVLAWMIVQKGTLRIGDIVLCGGAYGRIRAMYDEYDNEVEAALPSTPVKIAGLETVPASGSHFFVMQDIEEAREVAAERIDRGRQELLGTRNQPKKLEDLFRTGASVTTLPLILKADTPGSLEALRGELKKFSHPEVKVEILHEGVGGVNESDVSLASAAGAIIVAFHVVAEDRAEVQAEIDGVQIRRYNIIYEVTEHIKLALEGLLKPEKVEISTGRVVVLRTFPISRYGTIAGCRVLSGSIARNNRVRVIREQKILRTYAIASLRREKDDVRDVRDGMECGIRLDGFNDIKEGDIFEAYRVDEVQRTLESSAASS